MANKKKLKLSDTQIKDLINLYNELKVKNGPLMKDLVARFKSKYANIDANYHQLKYIIDNLIYLSYSDKYDSNFFALKNNHS